MALSMQALAHPCRFRNLAPPLAAALALAILAIAMLGASPAEAKKHKGKSSCENAQAEPASLTQPQAADAIRCLINKRRAQAGIGRLATNGKLNDAAQKHNDFMVDHGCFSHECSGEASMVTRIKSTGYLDGAMAWSIGENIAWGEQNLGSPAAIVQAWMNSAGHRANILNKSFDDIGIGVTNGTPENAGHDNAAVYTIDFGFSNG